MTKALPLLAALAGCATTPMADPAAMPGRCDAASAQSLVGQPADTAATEAQRLSGARTVRRYETGSPVTMDYREDRLNVETDAAGRIVRLTCG